MLAEHTDAVMLLLLRHQYGVLCECEVACCIFFMLRTENMKLFVCFFPDVCVLDQSPFVVTILPGLLGKDFACSRQSEEIRRHQCAADRASFLHLEKRGAAVHSDGVRPWWLIRIFFQVVLLF